MGFDIPRELSIIISETRNFRIPQWPKYRAGESGSEDRWSPS